MAGITDIAASMLTSAQRRLDVTAVNVSNVGTPGFRARRAFQQVVDARQALPVTLTMPGPAPASTALKATGNPLDIAITGGGTLLLRSGDRLMPAVSAQLRRDGEGHLVDGAGRVLQAAGGGDVVVSGDAPALLKDGTILIDGQAEAKVGAFVSNQLDWEGAGDTVRMGDLPDEAVDAVIHQGMVVPSNVDPGAEMVEITRAARMAETGARIFQVYDDLLGRVASKLGEVGR